MYSVTREQVAATIPGSELIPRSTDLSGFSRRWMDVPYGEKSQAQKLNVVLPNEGEGPFPLVVFIHGGGWLVGDKNHVQTRSINRLLYAGYAVCCVNYRLSDEAKFPEPLYDCKTAIRFLRANAEKYNLDVSRIGVAGNSAGGHLAALLGTTNGRTEYEDLSMGWAEDWKVAYPGRPFDNEISAEAYMLGHSIAEQEERRKAASPLYQIGVDTVPFYIQYGTGDHAIPWPQNPRFYQRYVEVLGSEHIQIRKFEGAEHSASVYQQDENVFEYVRFFDRYIRKIPPREYFPLGTFGDYRDSDVYLDHDPTWESRLVKIPYSEDRLMAVLPEGHPLADESEVQLSRLAEECYAFIRKDTMPYRLCMLACRDAGFTPQVLYTSHHLEAVIDMVRKGSCVSLLFSRHVAHRLKERAPGFVAVPITPEIRTTVCVAYLRDRKLSRATEDLIACFHADQLN